MVEVTLRGCISVHRHGGMNPTPRADSYMPVLHTCTVVPVPRARFADFVKKRQGWVSKKTRVGFRSMVEVTLGGYISVHGHDRKNLTPPADSYKQVVPAYAVTSALQACSVDFIKRQGWVWADLDLGHEKDKGGFGPWSRWL